MRPRRSPRRVPLRRMLQRWKEGPRLTFVGCNPSLITWQASARLDPTSANCEAIARRDVTHSRSVDARTHGSWSASRNGIVKAPRGDVQYRGGGMGRITRKTERRAAVFDKRIQNGASAPRRSETGSRFTTRDGTTCPHRRIQPRGE